MGTGRRLRGWRKIAGATWGHPLDPQIYGELEIDAGALERYIAAAQAGGTHLTVTHLIGRAVAHALAENPEVNVRRTRGRAIPRGSVDVFFIIVSKDGRELTGVKVEDAQRKSAVEVAAEVARGAARAHRGDDQGLGKAKPLLDRLPTPVLRLVLRVAAWLTSDRDIDLSRLGMSRQAFGGAMVTSMGMFGIERAYAPLAAYYRVPFLALVGEVRPKPVAIEGTVRVRPIVAIGVTMDHRYVDGHHAGRLAASVRAYCAEPERHEPPLPASR